MKKKVRDPDAERLRLARKEARRQRRRDEIVAAAVEVAAGTDLDGFTADDVAAVLAISTPSIFYYFPHGLMELRAAVALQRFYARYEAVGQRVDNAPTGVAALTAIVRGLAESYAGDEEGLGKELEILQRGAWGPELVERHVRAVNAMFSRVEARLLEDRAAGRLHTDVENLRRLGMLMNQLALGLVVGDQFRRKVGGGSKHALAAFVEDLCAIIERGLAAPGPPRTGAG